MIRNVCGVKEVSDLMSMEFFFARVIIALSPLAQVEVRKSSRFIVSENLTRYSQQQLSNSDDFPNPTTTSTSIRTMRRNNQAEHHQLSIAA